jgi:hypothetical protein
MLRDPRPANERRRLYLLSRSNYSDCELIVTDDDPATPERTSRRRTWVIVGVAVVALLALTGFILSAVLGGAKPGPTSSPSGATTSSPTATALASPTASPSVSPSPSASAAPAPDSTPVGKPMEEVPAPFESTPAVEPGLTVAVTSIKAIKGTADAPGEIAGPALQFVVEFTNSTKKKMSLQQVAVNADYGKDRTPAIELEQEESSMVPAEVGAGKTVKGSYVYNVPLEERDLVRLLVFTSVDAPIIAFEGEGPR